MNKFTNEELKKIVACPISDTVSCIVEIYWAPLSNRWVDRMILPVMNKPIGGNNENQMGAIASMFKKIQGINDYRHIKFYFMKRFSFTVKEEALSISLIGLLDTEQNKFYHRDVIRKFTNSFGKNLFCAEEALLMVDDFTTAAKDPFEKFRYYIDLYSVTDPIMIQTPDRLAIINNR